MSVMRAAMEHLGIDLTVQRGIDPHFKFTYNRSPWGSENQSMWGPLGFLLVTPLLLFVLFTRRVSPDLRVLAVAFLVFYVVQAFLTTYDPLRGRFFTMGALLAIPPIAVVGWSARSNWWRGYLTLALGVGCAVALIAVCERHGTYLFPMTIEKTHYNEKTHKSENTHYRSTFSEDSYYQAAREQPNLVYWMYVQYESLVPPHATVALDVDHAIETLFLFGENGGRKVLPIYSWAGKRSPLPAEADYLVYAQGSPWQQTHDVLLCEHHRTLSNIYLRNLKPVVKIRHKRNKAE
jgi:hypothetical protein